MFIRLMSKHKQVHQQFEPIMLTIQRSSSEIDLDSMYEWNKLAMIYLAACEKYKVGEQD